MLLGSLHSIYPSALNRPQDEPAFLFFFFFLWEHFLLCCLISTPSFSIPTYEFWVYPLLFPIHVPDNSRLRMGSEEVASRFQVTRLFFQAPEPSRVGAAGSGWSSASDWLRTCSAGLQPPLPAAANAAGGQRGRRRIGPLLNFILFQYHL